jgi:8-amino-7-oxononanoate synthase
MPRTTSEPATSGAEIGRRERPLPDPTHADRFSRLAARLDDRAADGRLRLPGHFRPEPGTPFVQDGDRRLLSFSSNDYLGLATDPDVVAGAIEAARSFGAGATSSRLVTGGLEIHERVEAELADFTGRTDALLFVSGFQANACVIPALMDRHDMVLCDRLSHASILHGCHVRGTRYRRFRHNDVDHLDALATAWRSDEGATGRLLIVTESVFSMDGDAAPLDDICEVAERHGAILMVDDAHAIGVFGQGGQGLAAAHPRVDLVLGTFGKAFGASGAFVATNATVRSYLLNFCDGVIYSTAPAPSTLGAVEIALAKIRSGALDQASFIDFAAASRARLRAAGYDPGPSTTHIVPILLGESRSSVEIAAAARDRGVLTVPIRPPTVPEGTARLRISLTRLHADEHLDALVEALDYTTQLDDRS